MLMIRFQRIGRANDPAFRIVVLEKERAAKAGNIVEQVGTYNPRSKALTLNAEQVKHWIAMGAQPTDSIRNLLINQKVIEGKKVNALPKKTVQVDEEAVAAAAKAEADAKAAKEAEKKAAADAAAAKAAEEAAAAEAAAAPVVAPVEVAEAVVEEAVLPSEAEVVAEVEAVADEVVTEAAPVAEEVAETVAEAAA
jgi:small subunit ribosomal protein S16